MVPMADEAPPLDEDELHTWISWLRLSAELPSALHRQLQADSDLTLQDYDVLVQLSEACGQHLRVSALARAVHWERSRLSHHIKRMEARGLVERSVCDDDGRGNLVALTPAGLDALRQAAPGHLRAVRELFFGGLDAGERDALRHLTDKMLARVEAPDEHAPRRCGAAPVDAHRA